MTRKPREDRASIVDSTLTLRLTHEDRMLLNELVALRTKQARRAGMEITIASFIRGLIRTEAEAQGIRLDRAPGSSPTTPTEEMADPNGSSVRGSPQ